MFNGTIDPLSNVRFDTRVTSELIQTSKVVFKIAGSITASIQVLQINYTFKNRSVSCLWINKYS